MTSSGPSPFPSPDADLLDRTEMICAMLDAATGLLERWRAWPPYGEARERRRRLRGLEETMVVHMRRLLSRPLSSAGVAAIEAALEVLNRGSESRRYRVRGNRVERQEWAQGSWEDPAPIGWPPAAPSRS